MDKIKYVYRALLSCHYEFQTSSDLKPALALTILPGILLLKNYYHLYTRMQKQNKIIGPSLFYVISILFTNLYVNNSLLVRVTV